MGRFADQASIVLRNRVVMGATVPEAKRYLQTRCLRSIAEREDAIAEVSRRFGGSIPEEYRQAIVNEEHFIALELEWMREFDNFKDDHFD